MNPARRSPLGSIAVRDGRYGGKSQPWSVVYVEPGIRTEWPTHALADQAVASWAVLEPRPWTPFVGELVTGPGWFSREDCTGEFVRFEEGRAVVHLVYSRNGYECENTVYLRDIRPVVAS